MVVATTFQKAWEVIHILSSKSPIKPLLIAVTPAPSQYPMKSEFQSTPTAKAKSFGIAREAYSKVFLKENPPMDKSIPGPG